MKMREKPMCTVMQHSREKGSRYCLVNLGLTTKIPLASPNYLSLELKNF